MNNVLIVGAGPTGLVLACDLARRGIPFRIVDRAPGAFSGSRGKGLSPRTLEVFEDLGLGAEVLAAGGPFPIFRAYQGHTVLWDKPLHELGGFAKLEPTQHRPYADYWMLPQSKTDELLRARLAELGGTVEGDTELVGLEQDDEGVTATLRHGDTTETYRAAYLVGADGGRSATRKLCGIGFIGETQAGERSLIADVHAEGIDRIRWHMWVTPGQPERRVALCPLPGTDYFQFVIPLGETPLDNPDLPLLQRIFDERSGRTDIRLHDLRWVSVHTVNVRLAERFRQGRVLLAGDAAHIHSPAGGQGLNTSVQDAYNLGWKLALACQGHPAALETYEAERLPVAAAVLGLTEELQAQGFGGKGAQREDIYQLDLGYRGGPLSRDDRPEPGALQAGDRAPDAVCLDRDGHPVRLFDLFRGPQFTLLGFEADASYAPMGTAGVTVGLGGLQDPNNEAHKAYDVSPGTFVLVRPDGYVGLVSRAIDHVEAYLDALKSERTG